MKSDINAKQGDKKENRKRLKALHPLRLHARHNPQIPAFLLPPLLQGSGHDTRIQEIFVINMKHDLLSDMLSIINNAESVGKKECIVPASSFVKNVLSVIQSGGYIGEIRRSKDSFHVSLLGKINRIRVVRPRFSVQKNEFDAWEQRYLPSKDTGLLVVSTPKGVMNQREAAEKGVGGKIVAYVY